MAKIAITKIQENENLLKDLSTEEESQIYGGFFTFIPPYLNDYALIVAFNNFTITETATVDADGFLTLSKVLNGEIIFGYEPKV